MRIAVALVLSTALNNRVLNTAGELLPADLRSLDALDLATALQLGADLGVVVTYDDRMLAAALQLELKAAAPA